LMLSPTLVAAYSKATDARRSVGFAETHEFGPLVPLMLL
jgi:hypothetical protein